MHRDESVGWEADGLLRTARPNTDIRLAARSGPDPEWWIGSSHARADIHAGSLTCEHSRIGSVM